MSKWIAALLCAALFLCPVALAGTAADGETDGGVVWVMYDSQGRRLASRAARMYEGDGLITADNTEYVVVSVDEQSRVAYAQPVLEMVAVSAGARTADASAAKDGGNKLVCMYCTHSDESYKPTDGEYSLARDAGIYDVSAAFAENLEKLGLKVERSEDTFLPHDAGAYRRSRSTAEEYAKLQPDAIFDIHRDGIPDAGEYEQTVDGEQITQVRLLVGRSNANADVNKSFAKQIKAQADEMYPGLIRDIYIGKGNYNQELYPHALLLEFGTFSNDKERVIASTEMMAKVVASALNGGTLEQGTGTRREQNAGAGKGIAWMLGILAIGGALYAIASTGTLTNWKEKLAHGASELTGGFVGRGHGDDMEEKREEEESRER